MRITIPPISQRLVDEKGNAVSLWYEKLKLIEQLEPLSEVVFPSDDTKSNVTRSMNTQLGTTYTFVLADAGSIVTFSNVSPVTVTVPLNSSVAFPIGTQIDVIAHGSGKVTFSPSGAVDIRSVSSFKSLSAQNAGATLNKFASDNWYLIGNLIA